MSTILPVDLYALNAVRAYMRYFSRQERRLETICEASSVCAG